MQMQGTQQPNRISDFDLMTELNTCIKQSAMQLTNAILESSSPQVRQQFEQALHTTLHQHDRLGQLMSQRNFYKPLPAGTESFQVARSQLDMASSQIGGAQAPGMNQAITTVGTGPVSPQMNRV